MRYVIVFAVIVLTLLLFCNSELRRRIAYRFGFVKTLPATVINAVPIKESTEEMCVITDSDDLRTSKQYVDSIFVRATVAAMLKKVELPAGYQLLILYGYRSKIQQEQMWNKEYMRISKEFPEYSEIQIAEKTRLLIAQPTGNGPHQTGGAVDVTLLYLGDTVDMGTKYLDPGIKTYMHSKEISQSQRYNRDILFSAMIRVGFWYYPNEWWHYCYGDRMWAAYTYQEFAIYGPL
jgi:zinc D-Ala-D-Ala dipeptidase